MFKLSIHENLHRFFKSPRVDFLTIKRRREDLLKSMRMVCIKYVTLCTVNIRTSTTSTPAFFLKQNIPKRFFPLPFNQSLWNLYICLCWSSIFPTRNLQKSRIQLLYLPRNQQKIFNKKKLTWTTFAAPPHRTPFFWFLSPAWRWRKCFLFFFLGSNNPSHLFDMRFIKPNAIN